MSENYVTAPVTEALLKAMTDTEQLLVRYNSPQARLNDLEHYGAAALQLEALANAALSARTSVSLLAPEPRGARFYVNSDSRVGLALDSVSAYLSTDAVKLLSNENKGRDNEKSLSKYNSVFVKEAVSRLERLYEVLITSILINAKDDLGRVSSEGVTALVRAAMVVAMAGDGKAADVVPEDEGRCPVMLDGGYRCTKRAGHRSSGRSDDPHTQN